MSGFLLPIVFVTFVWIDAAFTPGYSHISDTVSDLAEQGRSHAYVMRIGMLICAALLALFTTGMLRVIPPAHRRAIRVELFGASLMLAAAAIFQDWGPDPGGKRNLEGFVHTIAATAMIGFFISLMITILIAANANSTPSARHAMFRPSVGYLVAMTLCCLAFVFGPDHIEGLAQRGIFLTALAWLVTLTDVSHHADASNMERSQEGANKTPSVAGERPAQPSATA